MIYVLAVYDLPMGFVLDTLQRQKDINLGPASIIDAEQAPIPLCREQTFVFPPGHNFQINIQSTIYLYTTNSVRLSLNLVSIMVHLIRNTLFAV